MEDTLDYINYVKSSLNESSGFAALDLKEIGTVDGMPIYSSDKIKNNFIKALANQKITAPIAGEINDLVKKDIINPCYINSNIFKLILWKLLVPYGFGMKGVLGFYTHDNNRMYILLDSNVEFFNSINDAFIATVVFHELQHFCSFNLKQKFYGSFSKFLTTCYAAMYNHFYGITTIKPKDTIPVIQHLLKNIEWSSDLDVIRLIADYISVLENMLRNHIPDNPRDAASEMTAAVELFFFRRHEYINQIRVKGTIGWRLFYSAKEGYKAAGYRDVGNSLFGQESIFPSEFVCMASEKRPMPQHYSIVKSVNKTNIVTKPRTKILTKHSIT